jgi:hypothetical protein
MHLWDRLLPQAVMTLNMLRTSRINPKLSAATHICGQYDFNRAPMAPPGTRIIAHETPSKRRTWAPHGQDGWYIGPALEHYRCYTVYITKTRGNRIVETVDFFPEKFTLPFPSSQDLATQAAADLTHALLHPQPAGPFCQAGNEQKITLKRLASIFEGAKQRKSKNTLTPHRQGRKYCTSEGANHSFTSEGGRNRHRAIFSPTHLVSTINTKFTSQAKNTCQTYNHTTNTSCHGATQCQTTKFVPRYHG